MGPLFEGLSLVIDPFLPGRAQFVGLFAGSKLREDELFVDLGDGEWGGGPVFDIDISEAVCAGEDGAEDVLVQDALAAFEFFGVIEDVLEGCASFRGEGIVIVIFGAGGLDGENEPVELVTEGDFERGVGIPVFLAASPFAEVAAGFTLIFELGSLDAVEVEIECGGIGAEGRFVGFVGGGLAFGEGVLGPFEQLVEFFGELGAIGFGEFLGVSGKDGE